MNILVIDDDASLRRTLRTSLEVLGHQAAEAGDGAEALDLLGRRPFDVALLDLRLGQEQGLDLLAGLLGLAPGLHVVVVTAYATIETAVEAMRRGAFDYLPKPFTPDQLRLVLKRIAEVRRLQSHVEELEEQVRAVVPEVDLRTSEPAMQALDMAFKTGGHRSDGPAARRERHRQGHPGPGNPCPQPARRRPLRHGALPEPLGRAAGERAVRARAGGVHRGGARHGRQGGRRPKAARCFSTKSATCRWPCSPSCCGCSRSGATSGSGRRGPGPATSASWPPPTATWRPRWPPAASARTSSTAST